MLREIRRGGGAGPASRGGAAFVQRDALVPAGRQGRQAGGGILSLSRRVSVRERQKVELASTQS